MVMVACVAVFGICLRLWLPVGFHGMGFDEALYRVYLLGLDHTGLVEYDGISQAFLQDQRKPDSMCKLPPTRFLYVYCGWLWKRAAFGDAPPLDVKQPDNVVRDPALVSLHRISILFSILSFFLAGAAAWRLLGQVPGLVIFAFMAVAPLQLHMGGHALIDGFFAFWAILVLWSLWENLRQPNHGGWLTLYGIALVLMVVTKENAFFVFVAVMALLALNRWARFGTVSPRLLLITVGGPLVGVGILVFLAGGLSNLIEIYHLLVTKAEHLDYAILTGDGPWYRYLVDEMVLSPIILCLAIGAGLHLVRKNKPLLFLTGFIVFTYAIMCQVRHGMNLRYGTIWDFPLRALAGAQLADLSVLLGRWRRVGFVAAVVAICGYELWQYRAFFVADGLYEIPTASLLRAVDILK